MDIETTTKSTGGNGNGKKPPDGYVIGSHVRLSVTEMRMAILAAVDLQIWNIRYSKAEPRYGAGRDNDWQYTIEGVLGHLAFCKYSGLFYDPNMGNYKSADVKNFYEVRTHPHDYLIIHPLDRDGSPFVLVKGKYGEYDIEGWIYGKEGKLQEYWCDKFGHNRPAFFIPKDKLRDISTLP